MINEETFNDIVVIVRHWLKFIELNETYDCDDMYKLLWLSTRITKRSNHVTTRINLAATLSDLVCFYFIEMLLGNLVEVYKMAIIVLIYMYEKDGGEKKKGLDAI
jgi:hypothetical protein